MELFTLKKYTGYILLSRHRKGHGIHSPFVFDIVFRIFQNKIDPGIVFKIEKIRKKMIEDKRLIMVNDLGSGSNRMKSGSRKVSDIAKYSAVPKKYGILLFNLAGVFGRPSILEFGTSLGFSAMYMAAASPDSVVYTMEGCRTISEIASDNFKDAGFVNIMVQNGPFEDSLENLKNQNICPGFVFIDGNHRREPTVNYFEQIVNMAGNETVVVIDDIYYSTGMADAWEEIKRNKNVTVTIDICKMGIVFFREGLNHVNYVVRY
jgi:predicted O-methyltransferase YrrM